MPIYLYECEKCQLGQEVKRGMNDPESAPPCSNCNAAMKRVYSFGATRFKGAGFYSTDKRTGE